MKSFFVSPVMLNEVLSILVLFSGILERSILVGNFFRLHLLLAVSSWFITMDPHKSGPKSQRTIWEFGFLGQDKGVVPSFCYWWRVTRLPLINSWHHAASFLTSLSKCFLFWGGEDDFPHFFCSKYCPTPRLERYITHRWLVVFMWSSRASWRCLGQWGTLRCSHWGMSHWCSMGQGAISVSSFQNECTAENFKVYQLPTLIL